MNRIHRWVRLLVMVAACAGLTAQEPAYASLARNAAGARNIGAQERLTIDTASQLESDQDGKSWVFETGLQYQVSSRLQFLVESVLFERLEPDAGEVLSGLGDADVTLSWLASKGASALPSVVVGAKVKLPTAGEDLGTGKPDYSALLILGKESGELELSLEAEYATFGATDEALEDQLIYSLTAEYGLTDFLSVYAEAFGNSPPTRGEARTDAARAGFELDFPLGKTAAPYVSLETDTEGVGAIRAGVEWTW